MKVMLFLILLLLALCGAILYFGMSSPEKKAAPATPPTGPAVTNRRPPATGTPPAAKQPSGTGGTGVSAPAREQRTAIDMFTDYATGYTPLKVKQHSENKLSTIQKKRNAQLEKELNQ